MMRYAAREDANHSLIADALRQIGAYVVDCSQVGFGFPDLLVAFRGKWTPIEIKDGAKPKSARKLTPSQVIFHAEAKAKGCEVHIVESVEQAIKLIGSIGVRS